MKRCTIISFLLLLMAGSAVAGAYRWVDAQSKVHFGDHPPQEGGQALDIPNEAASAPAPDQQRLDAERRARQRKLLQSFQADRRAQQAARERRAAELKAHETKCTEARKRLQRYETLALLYRDLPNGERRYLSPAERRQLIAAARDNAARLCD